MSSKRSQEGELSKALYQPIEITDPLKLPELYLLIPNPVTITKEKIEQWDKKLQETYQACIRRPFTIYRYCHRYAGVVDFCIDVRDLTKEPN